MASDEHTQPAPTGELNLREYLIRAAKAYLCVVCWSVIVAALLIYGPPSMSMPTTARSLQTTEVVDAIFGILLSAGTGTVLTILLIVGVVVSSDRQHSQSTDEQDQSVPDTTDSGEDETHA